MIVARAAVARAPGMRLRARQARRSALPPVGRAAAPGAAWSWSSGRATRDGSYSAGSPTRRRARERDRRGTRASSRPRRLRARRSNAGSRTVRCRGRSLAHHEATAPTTTSHARAGCGATGSRAGGVRDARHARQPGMARRARDAAAGDRARSAGGWVPIGNPFSTATPGCATARVVRALALAGQTHNSRAGTRLSFAPLPASSGALLSPARAKLDGAGGDSGRSSRRRRCRRTPRGRRLCHTDGATHRQWLRRQRNSRARARGKMRVDWPGLLPFGDPRDAELVRSPLVGNDAWAIAGSTALPRSWPHASDQRERRSARGGGAPRGVRHRARALGRRGRANVVGRGRSRLGQLLRGLPRRARAWRCAHGRARGAVGAVGPGTGVGTVRPIRCTHCLGTDLAVWALLVDSAGGRARGLGDLLEH